MTHHLSAKKRIRQTKKRTEANMARRNRIRTYVRKVEEAVASGDKEAAKSAFDAAMPELQRSVTKGVLHKNTAARKIGRLARQVKVTGA